MKVQWFLIISLLFAIIIAVFAVNNVDAVPVNYVFGEAQWPLILIILLSAFAGALISGSFALFRSYRLSREVKSLKKEMAEKESKIASQQNEISAYKRSSNEPGKPDERDELIVVTDEKNPT
ncbi:LapA family protein [Planococcus lenghuensis]|uniref:Lipopolysaccharide assembly protein A domain-containing protein n=1 Tax=Planococcus lenghuensis TaxID=2213202 RepID=A0A1Q2KXN8_9BACL|nr:lipopolysaccharide assembly protein LapA domain-containing protein [Planococcus lenghuensis]AQQ52913.1 hypothetical protein B0X71_07295 [Planococcus lenghuensis]